MADAQIKIDGDTSGFDRALNNTAKRLQEFGLNLPVSKFAGLASTAAVAGATIAGVFTVAVANAIRKLDDLDERAQNLGVTASKLSAIDISARASGVDNIDTALNKFNQTLADAKGGSEKASIVIQALGINLKELRGGTISTEQALAKAADAVAEFKDDFEQSNLVMEAFGAKNAKLIAFLNQGAEGLTKFGGVSDESVRNAARLQGEIDKLSASFSKLTLEVGGTAAAIANAIIGTGGQSIEKQIKEAEAAVEFLTRDLESKKDRGRGNLTLWEVLMGSATERDKALADLNRAKANLNALREGIRSAGDDARMRSSGSQAPNVEAELEKERKRKEAEKEAARLEKERLEGESKRDLLRRQRQDEAERAADEIAKAEAKREEDRLDAAANFTQRYLEDLNARAAATLANLQTEREVENARYQEQLDVLNAFYATKFDADAQFQAAKETLEREHQERLTEIEDAQIRKRFGIQQVYRKADLNATSAFLNQMSVLMNTNSRTQFEIGKAAAIAGAIVDTYKAATGAYASLASIPFVGPVLGAAAAAAAIAAGIANVQRIKKTQFGQQATAGGAVAPLPGAVTTPVTPASAQGGQAAQTPQTINVTLTGSRFSAQDVRDLIEQINDEGGFGANVVVNRG